MTDDYFEDPNGHASWIKSGCSSLANRRPDKNTQNLLKPVERIVKRYYKCNQDENFKRQIIALYSPNKECKSNQNPFKNCSGNILITYSFSGNERNIKPCNKVRVYESTKDEIKNVSDVENAIGGLTKITNQSEIPNRSVAFEINRKRAIESRCIDLLRQLINNI